MPTLKKRKEKQSKTFNEKIDSGRRTYYTTAGENSSLLRKRI